MSELATIGAETVERPKRKPCGHVKHAWGEEQIALLTKLWKDGVSAKHIASEIGGGITRSAVIGKVHRLGLSGTQPRRARKPRRPRRSVSGPRRQRWLLHPLEVVDPVAPLDVGFFDLKFAHCRWESGKGEGGLPLYCGHEQIGRSFCRFHHSIAYVRVSLRKAQQ